MSEDSKPMEQNWLVSILVWLVTIILMVVLEYVIKKLWRKLRNIRKKSTDVVVPQT